VNFIPQIEPYFTQIEERAVSAYMQSGGWLTEHKATAEFEELVQSILGVKYAVAVPNGTIGLYLALRAALPAAFAPPRGCNILVPAYTMIATVNAIKWAGMNPILVDIDPDTGCLYLDAIPESIPVQAMMYVSLNGRGWDIAAVQGYCASRGIILIEDACQAFMSSQDYKMYGTFGDIGVYSMSPHKVITTGQGGIIVTNHEAHYRKLKALKDFGRAHPGVDIHPHFGLNFKFTDLQAIIGIQQLSNIKYRISRKLDIFNAYKEALPKSMKLLPLLPGNVPWFVDVLCEDGATRDRLEIYLKENNIGSRKFYPALNTQRCMAEYSTIQFPNAEDFSSRGLWLPSSIGLTNDQLVYIFDTLNKFQ
jgi:perosamine synthetase